MQGINVLNNTNEETPSVISIDDVSEANGILLDNSVLINNGEIQVDNVNEYTSGGGVTIDGTLIKDGVMYCDTLDEKTTSNGVNVCDVLMNNGSVKINSGPTLSYTSGSLDVDKPINIYSNSFRLIYENSSTPTYDCDISYVIASYDPTIALDLGASGYDYRSRFDISSHRSSSVPSRNVTFGYTDDGTLIKLYCGTKYIYLPQQYSITGSGGRDLQIDINGMLYSVSSTRNSKTNIDSINDVSWIYNLTPRKFNYRISSKVLDEDYVKQSEDDPEYIYKTIWSDTEYCPELEYGLIYDEVEQVGGAEALLDNDENGNPFSVYYKKLIVPLLKCVQDQKKQITSLQARCAALEQRIEMLE